MVKAWLIQIKYVKQVLSYFGVTQLQTLAKIFGFID